MDSYIVFNKNYIGSDSKTEYKKGVKYKIHSLKDGFYHLSRDKVEIKFENKLYTTGKIITKDLSTCEIDNKY